MNGQVMSSGKIFVMLRLWGFLSDNCIVESIMGDLICRESERNV